MKGVEGEGEEFDENREEEDYNDVLSVDRKLTVICTFKQDLNQGIVQVPRCFIVKMLK